MESLEDIRLACPLAGDVRAGREALALSDGCVVEVYHYAPAAGEAAAPPVLYVHGIQSHPGWFSGSAQALARAGHEVFQVTRRGSGTVRAGRGDAPSAARLIEDVTAAAAYVRDRSGADRLALVGVSWGGKLLTAYALTGGDDRISSLTLVAPGIIPRVDVSPAAKLAIAAARLFCPGRRFEIPLNDPALFTDNPAMREYLRTDPHRLHTATARFLVASRVLDRLIARASAGVLAVPTTLILAARDRIIDNAATRAVIDRLTARSARIVELDAAHTVEFEPDPTTFHKRLREATD